MKKTEMKKDRNQSVDEFIKRLQFCPGCRRTFDDHQILMLASAPIGANSDNCATVFLKAIKNHDWANVLSFQEWQGGSDNYELYAIRSTGHPLVLVTVLDPVELFFDDRVIETEMLKKSDSDELLSMAARMKGTPS